MGDKPFIKFYPIDFLAGTSSLSAAERGVYITLLCLMWEKDGPILREDKRLARSCGMTTSQFRRCLNALIQTEAKIEERDGFIESAVLRDWRARARHMEARPAIPLAVQAAVWLRDGETCAYCGTNEPPFHLDHIIPWSRGGDHTPGNLTVACAACNMSKADRTPEEWKAVRQ